MVSFFLFTSIILANNVDYSDSLRDEGWSEESIEEYEYRYPEDFEEYDETGWVEEYVMYL